MCHYGGGCGNFSKVKRSFESHWNTETVILRISVAVWDVRNAVTFVLCIQQDNHICIFSPAHRLLESVRELEVRVILGAWRLFLSNLGGFEHFRTPPCKSAIFFITLKECIFGCRFFELSKKVELYKTGAQ